MLVTPRNKKFGKFAVGETFELKDKVAKVLIKVGKVAAANPAQSYATRDMRPAQPAPTIVVEEPITVEESAESTEEAPYGYKADGTPRKRPGRQAS